MEEYKRPREYHLSISINAIVTVPTDPERDTWIAYLSGSPTEAVEGTSENDAIGELIKSLVELRIRSSDDNV